MIWTEKVTRMECVKCVDIAAQGSVTLMRLKTKWGIMLNMMFCVLDDGTMNTYILRYSTSWVLVGILYINILEEYAGSYPCNEFCPII
jgi:hypothetical protein